MQFDGDTAGHFNFISYCLLYIFTTLHIRPELTQLCGLSKDIMTTSTSQYGSR